MPKLIAFTDDISNGAGGGGKGGGSNDKKLSFIKIHRTENVVGKGDVGYQQLFSYPYNYFKKLLSQGSAETVKIWDCAVKG